MRDLMVQYNVRTEHNSCNHGLYYQARYILAGSNVRTTYIQKAVRYIWFIKRARTITTNNLLCSTTILSLSSCMTFSTVDHFIRKHCKALINVIETSQNEHEYRLLYRS